MRIADALYGVAAPPRALGHQPLAQQVPRARVECTPGDQPELALLSFLINGDLVDHPVGVGWLEPRCAFADAPHFPAGTVQYQSREIGHGVRSSGLLHG